jgi:hypothetical protein
LNEWTGETLRSSKTSQAIFSLNHRLAIKIDAPAQAKL